ncbi:MAG: hypothetical protein U0528_20475 [Anaerolineae bacterium]
MHTFLLDLLVCPTCHHELTWTQVVRDGDRVNSAVAGVGLRSWLSSS